MEKALGPLWLSEPGPEYRPCESTLFQTVYKRRTVTPLRGRDRRERRILTVLDQASAAGRPANPLGCIRQVREMHRSPPEFVRTHRKRCRRSLISHSAP